MAKVLGAFFNWYPSLCFHQKTKTFLYKIICFVIDYILFTLKSKNILALAKIISV